MVKVIDHIDFEKSANMKIKGWGLCLALTNKCHDNFSSHQREHLETDEQENGKPFARILDVFRRLLHCGAGDV